MSEQLQLSRAESADDGVTWSSTLLPGGFSARAAIVTPDGAVHVAGLQSAGRQGNTEQIGSFAVPKSDIVALSVSHPNTGILTVPKNGSSAFTVAAANVGVSGDIRASANTGRATLPAQISCAGPTPRPDCAHPRSARP